LPSSSLYVYALTVSPNKAGGTDIFAGTWGSIFLSTNNGTSWKTINSGLTAVTDIAVIPASNGTGGSKIFASTTLSFDLWHWAVYGGGIFFTTNYGLTWTSINVGLMNNDVFALAVSGNDLFAATDYGVHRLNDNGTSWTRVGLEYNSVSTLVGNGTSLFAGTQDKAEDWSLRTRFGSGVFRSTNNGTSWTAVNNGLTNLDVRSLAVSGTNLFVGTFGGGVFLSTNNGTSWTAVNKGLMNTAIWSLSVSGTNLFAGTDSGGVWRRPLSEMILTDVEEFHASFPENYSLEQNYPNPFNPSTRIEFSIPHAEYVTLKVFDMAGREVAKLVNSTLKPGSHELTFDGTDFTSGVYFYRLQAGESVQTKKFVLQK
jgi:hypothetical protein